MEKPPFRVKRYSHRKYKFVVRSKLAGKWKRRYFKTKAEAIACATELNTNSLKRQKGHLDKSNVPHGDGCSRPLARGAITATKNAVGVLGMHRRAPVIHRYLNGTWSMRLPFAYDLMRELRPRIFVELGVYQGNPLHVLSVGRRKRPGDAMLRNRHGVGTSTRDFTVRRSAGKWPMQQQIFQLFTSDGAEIQRSAEPFRRRIN